MLYSNLPLQSPVSQDKPRMLAHEKAHRDLTHKLGFHQI